MVLEWRGDKHWLLCVLCFWHVLVRNEKNVISLANKNMLANYSLDTRRCNSHQPTNSFCQEQLNTGVSNIYEARGAVWSESWVTGLTLHAIPGPVCYKQHVDWHGVTAALGWELHTVSCQTRSMPWLWDQSRLYCSRTTTKDQSDGALHAACAPYQPPVLCVAHSASPDLCATCSMFQLCGSLYTRHVWLSKGGCCSW